LTTFFRVKPIFLDRWCVLNFQTKFSKNALKFTTQRFKASCKLKLHLGDVEIKEAQERDFWGHNKTNPKNENEEQKNVWLT